MNALEFPVSEISVHNETDYTLIIRRVLHRLIMGPPILRKVPLMRKVDINGLINHAEIHLKAGGYASLLSKVSYIFFILFCVVA